MNSKPIFGESVPAVKGKTNYPSPFAERVAGRTKRKLGDVFELENFGVNLTTLEPGAVSALAHHHKKQDEFVYVLQGRAMVVLDDEEYELEPGECIGFKAKMGVAHQIINRSDAPVTFLEIGDRTPGDEVTYPHDDIAARLNKKGVWVFSRKNGKSY